MGRRRVVHDRASPGCRSRPTTRTVNVEAQRDDPGSLLSLYRRLLALRRSEPDLLSGAYRTLEADDRVLRFARGDSIEVTIDFESGDGSIVRSAHGREGVNKW